MANVNLNVRPEDRPEKRIFAGRDKVRVAAVQQAQSVFNKEKAVRRACEAIKKAGENGAQLVAFSECFLTCFPAYFGSGNDCNVDEVYQWNLGWQDSSIVIPGPETDVISQACKDAGVYCVMGVNEMDERVGVRTIYNSQVFFGPDGKIIGRHRKINPTSTERFYHGFGDGSDIGAYATDIGRVGFLICGEHRNISASIPQMMTGEEIHIANYPGTYRMGTPGTGEPLNVENYEGYGGDLHMMCQEYAAKSGAFVIVVNGLLRDEDFEPEYQNLRTSDHMNYGWANGGSFILGPGGDYITKPIYDEETIIYADLNPKEIQAAKVFYDCFGHYSRPDITQVTLNDTVKTQFLRRVSASGSVLGTNAAPENIRQISEEFEVRVEKLEGMMARLEEQLSKLSKLQ